MKKQILNEQIYEGVEPFVIKFNVFDDGIIVPKAVRFGLSAPEPFDVGGLDPKTWFQRILGNKLVISVEQSQKYQHLKSHFEFLEVENVKTDYIAKTLYDVLTKVNQVNIFKFEYELV